MPPVKSLVRSIVLHGVVSVLAQAVVLVAVTIAFGTGTRHLAVFLAVSIGYNVLMSAILVIKRRDVRIEATGQMLSRVNLSNTLTYIRLSSLPTILFLVVQARSSPDTLPVILPLICAVFATDFFDGMAARRRNEITFVGRYLDSASDYLTIIAVTILLYLFDLLALWFFVLVLARLVLFALAMILLALREGKPNPLSTFLGKASIFALMVLYAMEVARLFSVPWIGDEEVVQIVTYVVAAIVVASIVDKALFLARRFSAARRQKSSASGA
jgi:cardiolipin synthase